LIGVGLLLPLVVYLAMKGDSEYVAANAREAQAHAQVKAAEGAVATALAQLRNAKDVTLPRTTAAALAGFEAARNSLRLLAAGPRPDAVRQAAASVAAAQSNVAGAQARLVAGDQGCRVEHGRVRQADAAPDR